MYGHETTEILLKFHLNVHISNLLTLTLHYIIHDYNKKILSEQSIFSGSFTVD